MIKFIESTSNWGWCDVHKFFHSFNSLAHARLDFHDDSFFIRTQRECQFDDEEIYQEKSHWKQMSWSCEGRFQIFHLSRSKTFSLNHKIFKPTQWKKRSKIKRTSTWKKFIDMNSEKKKIQMFDDDKHQSRIKFSKQRNNFVLFYFFYSTLIFVVR